MMSINYGDESLFGNLAADDEKIEDLNFYFIDKTEFNRFRNNNNLVIVRARKGMGKSALLRKVAYEKEIRDDAGENLVISIKGSDLSSLLQLDTSNDENKYINDWMSRICSRISLEIGKNIKLALKDDSITLVENAEIEGFKSRNIFGALFERIKAKGLIDIDVEKKKVLQSIKLVERYQEHNDVKVWVFIDDIDATFRNSDNECKQLTSFFTACRYLASDVHNLYLRITVRTDVWTAIEKTNEAMDKVEQYLLDLNWSEFDTRSIIASRVRNYLYNNDDDKKNSIYLQQPLDEDEIDKYMERVFVKVFPWGRGERKPSIPIHTLANRRPRWALQLCSLAALSAKKKNHYKIDFGDIRDNLKEFSRKRLVNLTQEHKHQCDQIEELIQAFYKSKTVMSTTELLTLINGKILSKIDPYIGGVFGKAEALDVAYFLYKIGFIAAREDKDNGEYEHHYYEEDSSLLNSQVDIDKGYRWEIHPCYREAINKDIVFSLKDKEIKCKDCGNAFLFTESEQEFYKEKNLLEPKRCQECRQKRRGVI